MINLGSGRATTLFLPVAADLAWEANLKMPLATPTVVVMLSSFIVKPKAFLLFREPSVYFNTI